MCKVDIPVLVVYVLLACHLLIYIPGFVGTFCYQHGKIISREELEKILSKEKMEEIEVITVP